MVEVVDGGVWTDDGRLVSHPIQRQIMLDQAYDLYLRLNAAWVETWLRGGDAAVPRLSQTCSRAYDRYFRRVEAAKEGR